MRHILALAVAAGFLGLGVVSAPAQANEALSNGAELSTTQPRDTNITATDRIAYDIDFSGSQLGRVSSKG